MVVNSMMFSSTLQILEAYRSSPTSSIYSRFDLDDDGPQSSHFSTGLTRTEGPFNPYTELLPTSPESSYRTSYSSQSPTNSPASSATSAFSDSFQSQRGVRKEIRRRRSPTSSEPRPKDLKLLSSNGATSLKHDSPPSGPAVNAKPLPRLGSPEGIPPPPPPKNGQSRPAIQDPPWTLQDVLGNKATKPAEARGITKENQTLEPGSIITASVVILPPAPPSLKLVVPWEKSAAALPDPANDDPAKNFNFPNPRQGIRRPVHQKSISTSSQNKPLPPGPPLPELPRSQLPEYRTVSAPRELETIKLHTPPPKALPAHPQSHGKSNMALNIFNSFEPSLPDHKPLDSLAEDLDPTFPKPLSLPIANSTSIPPSKNLVTKSQPVVQSQSQRRKLYGHKPSPSSGSVGSSLTNASLSGPFYQPQLPAGPRLRTKTPTPPPQQRPTTPQPPQETKMEQRQPSLLQQQQDISGIPEIRNPLVASKLMPSHFNCYIQHKQLVPSSNASAPVLCMACDYDSEQMWKCGWCCLRICAVCKDVMASVNGDLKTLIDERKNGKAELVPIRMNSTDIGVDKSESPMILKTQNVPSRSETPMSLRTRNTVDRSETPLSLRTRNIPDRSGTPMSLRTRDTQDRNETTMRPIFPVPERTESALSFRTRNQPERSESSLSSKMRVAPNRSNSPMNSSLRSEPSRSDTPMSLRIGNAIQRSEQSAGLKNGSGIPDFDSFVPVIGPGMDLGMGLRGGRGMPGQRLVV